VKGGLYENLFFFIEVRAYNLRVWGVVAEEFVRIGNFVMSQSSSQPSARKPLLRAHREHPRHFRDNLLVYPVLSRRSGGVSVGINLSPHKGCNFDCLYCQVERNVDGPEAAPYSLDLMAQELRHTIDLVLSGDLFNLEPFDQTPEPLRRLNDVALSGDGEPTAEKDFLATCRRVAQIKTEMKLDDVKIILITNAALFHKEDVQKGLALLGRHQGQIWAKLDAGSEAFYQFMNKTSIPLQRVLENITQAACQEPLYIQTLFTRINGRRINRAEVNAYAKRINAILAAGGDIIALQLYTIARTPADSRVSSLSDDELDEIASEVRERVNLPIETYYG